MNNCFHCGQPMSNQRRKQCGDPACYRAYRTAVQREYLAGVKASTGIRYEDRYKRMIHCQDCGDGVPTRHRSTRRCRSCAQRYTILLRSAAGVAVRVAVQASRVASRKQVVLAGPVRPSETLGYRLAARRLALAAEGSRSKNAIYVGATCRRCGAAFVCLWTNSLPAYCSLRCLRSTSKVARRARARGGQPVPYSRAAILERDKWVCQICGKRTIRSARVPHPKAPVIDHIVPLAAGADSGGVDAPWNVQCAHFLCNSIKSDSYVAPALF